MTANPPTFLFSIDLEDIRELISGGDRYRERVPEMTERYLAFLREHSAKCTFFVVGRTARRYPDLIRAIVREGHEVGCHTDLHTPLTELNRDSFREDLRRNIGALAAAGAGRILGFRAPTLSLTEETAWAHEVLAEMGFTYSSSVLPARSPLFGWPEFGPSARRLGGITEVPISVRSGLPPRVPFAAGVYFRVLPWTMVRGSFRSAMAAGRPVIGYFHPYDIDTEQERFMHPGINGSRFYNRLMYAGRGRTLPRLRQTMGMGWRIQTYRDYVESLEVAR